MAKFDDFIFSTLNGSQYDYLNKAQNTKDYVLYMLNRSLAMFHYEGLPETIPAIQLEKINMISGFTIWAENDGKLYAFSGGLGGEQDVYYMPTIATVANPALNLSKNFTIDKDCVIMPNDSMFVGLMPLFNRYCALMNENDVTMLLADVNKRVSFLLSATDDNTAESAKVFLQQLFDGKQGVITDTKILNGLQVNKTSENNQSIMDLVEYQQYLRASLYNEIGLNSNFNMKRERLNTSEVEMNSGNLYPLVDDMLNSRKNALEKINKMFGTNITVEFASSWTMRATEFDSGTDGTQDDTNSTDTQDDASGNNAAQDTADGTQDDADSTDTQDDASGNNAAQDTADGTQDDASKGENNNG